MAYTVNDMLTLFRRSAEDSAFYPDRNFPNATSLWSNFELIQYLNEAQRIFAERILGLPGGECWTNPVFW